MKKTLSLFVALLAVTGAAYALPSCDNTLATVITNGGCTIGSVDFTNFSATLSASNQTSVTTAGITLTGSSAASMVGLAFTPTSPASTFSAATNGTFNWAQQSIKINYQFNWMGGGSNPFNLVQYGLNGVAFDPGNDPNFLNSVQSGKSIYDPSTGLELSSFPISKIQGQAGGNFVNPAAPGSMNIGGLAAFGVGDTVAMWAYTANEASSSSITGFSNQFSYVPTGDGQVPEPMSLVLLGSGLLAFGLLRRKSA